MSLESAFQTVYGRSASPEETNRFNRLAKELGIRDNDAVWSFVFLLGHHLELTNQMPERLSISARQTFERFDGIVNARIDAAEAELRLSKVRIEEGISSAVLRAAEKEIARSAQAVARYTAGKSWLQWLGVAGLIGMAAFAGAFYWGYSTGQHTGYAFALDVKQAASWAATPAGQAAYKLDRSGELMHMVRCDQDGWKVERTESGERGCFVHPLKDGRTIGWVIP